MEKKLCFVVMGFGEKVDLATGRTLDLDKSYRIIIKKAVEDAGLECVRADGIIHAGVIDKPMYEMLLKADVVIADLSTSNANAIYELGVRHALRPYTTIVIAEDQFKFPFDIGHLVIRKYQHMGKGIDAEEAEKMRNNLKTAILKLLNETEPDSPVFTFLPGLSGATLLKQALNLATDQVAATEQMAAVLDADLNATQLMDQFKESRAACNWPEAIVALNKLLLKRPDDVYLNQQLALATYKSNPKSIDALATATSILSALNPDQTTDPETLGLWGAVHKRLFELSNHPEHLDKAIWAYEKGFHLNSDHYNGINFAYLLNVRATISSARAAIADQVNAERIYRSVITICQDLLKKGIKDDNGNIDKEQQFWVEASLTEAYVGLAMHDEAETAAANAKDLAPEPWMIDTMDNQINKLKKLLETTPV